MLESQFGESKKTITEVANREDNSRIQRGLSLCGRRKRRCDRGEEVVSDQQDRLCGGTDAAWPTGHERQSAGGHLCGRRRKRISVVRQGRDEANRGRASPRKGENR